MVQSSENGRRNTDASSTLRSTLELALVAVTVGMIGRASTAGAAEIASKDTTRRNPRRFMFPPPSRSRGNEPGGSPRRQGTLLHSFVASGKGGHQWVTASDRPGGRRGAYDSG